jgi:predicted transposase/invertase (TIGR01784 family)
MKSSSKKGKVYKLLNPAICIHILNFNLFQDKLNFHTILGIVDLETQVRFLEDFEIHFMELPKVSGKYYNTLNNWMRFLKNPSKEEVISMGDKAIFKALDTLEYLSQDPAERARYEARRKYLLDYNTSMLTAEERGIEIGEKRGIDIGERLKALEIAKSMRKLGLPIEVVKQTTGLSYEEIEKL